MRKTLLMEKVISKHSKTVEDNEDLIYWASLSISERLSAVHDWNLKVWEHLNKKTVLKIEKVGGIIKKNLKQQDDF
jgi:hypothetical protein